MKNQKHYVFLLGLLIKMVVSTSQQTIMTEEGSWVWKQDNMHTLLKNITDGVEASNKILIAQLEIVKDELRKIKSRDSLRTREQWKEENIKFVDNLAILNTYIDWTNVQMHILNETIKVFKLETHCSPREIKSFYDKVDEVENTQYLVKALEKKVNDFFKI